MLPDDNGPRAAVLIALYGPGPDYRLLYTVRTHQAEHHKGEISFPAAPGTRRTSGRWGRLFERTSRRWALAPRTSGCWASSAYPSHQFGDHVIFGATAIMTTGLLALLPR